MLLQRRERPTSYLPATKIHSADRCAPAPIAIAGQGVDDRCVTPAGKTEAAADANPVMTHRRTVDPVAEWRRRRLLAAGFTSDLAVSLAAQRSIDLHAMLELVDRGCPPELAVRILAPLEDGRGSC
jgi:hypothetical protein